MTPGGRLKDAARSWPEAAFRALTSAGDGSTGALNSVKKLDWGKIVVVGAGKEAAPNSGVSFVAIEWMLLVEESGDVEVPSVQAVIYHHVISTKQ